jgi:hypothetical protein
MIYRSRYSEFGIGASLKDRDRGGGMQKLRPDAPLTSLLYQERPLLRPIVFVPSVLNPTLFDQDETLLKPGVEEIGMFSYPFFSIQTGRLNYNTTQVILNKVLPPRYHGRSAVVTFLS